MKKRLLLSRLATITAFVFLAGQAWGALNWDGYFTNVLAKGNLRIGTGSTPDITQNGDDLFIEGQLEVDGVPRFDATTMILRGVTYTLPSADGTVGQQLTTNGSGTLSWAGPGTATAWDDISNPDANDTITFGTYTMALTGSQTAADGFTIENTGNFGNISVLKVQQITGNPTDGTVLEVISADTDADAMVVTANSVDVLKVNGAGTLTVTGATGITGDVAITGSLSTTGALYQTAIASAAAGNTALTIDASGNGTITIGGTSTGNTILPGAVVANGNVDIGNAASDTLTITSSIDGSVTLDDGVTDSPSLILKDATDETATLVKSDGADLSLTMSSASRSLYIPTGNLKVGNGSPGTAAMNGDDAYIKGQMEVDGAVQLDGALTGTAGATVSGGVINLNASSNNAVNIGTGTTTSTVTIGGAGTQQIDIANGAAAKTLNLGSSNTTSTTTILSGSGGINLNVSNNQPVNIGTGTTTGTVTIGGAGAQSIAIGDGAAAKTVSLGSSNTTSTTTLLSGSGGLNLNVSNNQPTNIGSGTTTGTITIGGAGAQQLDIGNGAAAKTVNLGSSNTTSTTTILSGSGGIKVNESNNQPVDIGTGTSTGTVTVGGAAAQTIAIGNGAAAKTVTLGSTNTTSTTTINAGSGNINLVGALATGDAITGDGTAALGGFLKTVTNDVDAHSVTVGESGTVLTNAGNDGDPVGEFTLPSAAIGLTYTFVVMAAQELRVIPAAGDAINIAGVQGDAAEYWTANAVGETLTIVAVDVNNWVATSYSGTWTQQTP